jgi:hypothetical protein
MYKRHARWAIALLTAAFSIAALAQNKPAMMFAGFSPAPLWPNDGDVSRYPNQHVFLRPQASEYLITYVQGQGDTAQRVTLHSPAHSFVNAAVTTAVSKDGEGLYHYSYTFSNNAASESAIESAELILEATDSSLVTSHPSWRAALATASLGNSAGSAAQVVRWNSTGDSSYIQPGAQSNGFTVASSLAPGYLSVVVKGHSGTPELDSATLAALPPDVRQQLSLCKSAVWDGQTVQVIGPRFPKSATVAQVAANFRLGLQRRERGRASTPGTELLYSALDSVNRPNGTLHGADLDSLRTSIPESLQGDLAALQLALDGAAR